MIDTFNICVAYESDLRSDYENAVPVFVPSAACRKPEAIEKNLKDQKDKWEGEAYDNLYTIQIRSWRVAVFESNEVPNIYSSVDLSFSELAQVMCDRLNKDWTRRVAWFGEHPKLFAKYFFNNLAATGQLAGANSEWKYLAQKLFHKSEHYTINNLLFPSGLESRASIEWVIDCIAGKDSLMRQLARRVSNGEASVDEQLDYAIAVFSRFGLLNAEAPELVG